MAEAQAPKQKLSISDLVDMIGGQGSYQKIASMLGGGAPEAPVVISGTPVSTAPTSTLGSFGSYGPATIGAAIALNAGMNAYQALAEPRTNVEQKRWAQLAKQGYAVPDFVKQRMAGQKVDPNDSTQYAFWTQRYGKDWENADPSLKAQLDKMARDKNLFREYRGTADLRVDPNFEMDAARMLGRDENAAQKAGTDASAWNAAQKLKGGSVSESDRQLYGYGDKNRMIETYVRNNRDFNKRGATIQDWERAAAEKKLYGNSGSAYQGYGMTPGIAQSMLGVNDKVARPTPSGTVPYTNTFEVNMNKIPKAAIWR